MKKSYSLQKKGHRHKHIKKKDYIFEAFFFSISLSLTTSTLGIITIHSPNFIKFNNLEEEKTSNIENITKEVTYYVKKTKNRLNIDESDIEFVEEKSLLNDFNEIEETFEEKIIKKYCNIYQVDYYTVYDKLASLTDNFTSEEYLNGTIPGITLKEEPVNFTNHETLLLVAVRCCKQTPEAVGLSFISVEDYYVTDETTLEQISYYSDLFQVDKQMTYAILKSECGFKSDFTSKTNNLASIKFEGKFATFDNDTQSIIELCTELYKYNKMGLYSIEEIAPSYAPLEDNNENWIPNVIDCYREAENIFSENKVLVGNKL